MKCKNCGGNIRFENGSGLCESCGSEYKLEPAFENVDVYICYVENDVQDRRTRDSMIAQDVYQRLEGANINTFYERFSAANLADENLEVSSYQAFYHAKIVLILATTVQNFEKLVSDYQDILADKKIIPIYAGMNAYDIPKELSKYQALNYDSVGSITDLIKNVLKLLGRDEEADVLKIARLSDKKKKTIIITAILVFFAVLLGVGAYIAFGTSLIFQNHGQISEEDKASQYSIAQELQEKGEYAQAINIFYSLGDYKDSPNRLTKLYANYEGYYQSDDGLVSFYLNIDNNTKSRIELEKKLDGKLVKINESAEIQGTVLSFEFIDSQANQGTASIELQNKSISLNTIITVNNDDLSIGELNESFEIAKRSDKPLNSGLTKEILLKWVSEKTTLDDIKQMGYEVEYEDCLYGPIGDTADKDANIYTIKNTNVKLLFLSYDVTKATVEKPREDFMLDEAIVVALIAPAEILTPTRISEDFNSFVEDEILYLVGVARFDALYHPDCEGFSFVESEKLASDKIERNTQVGITCKEIIGNKLFGILSGVGDKESTTPNETPGDYSESGILPFSSDRLLTEDDLVFLSSEELILARNEPYARHGRIFKVDWIREYFEAQPWYHGTLTEEEFSSDLFSDIEMKNIMFIKEYEEKLEN